MKKSILLSAFLMGALAVNAQTDETALQGTKLSDNWSIGLKAGAVTPLTHHAFFPSMRPAFGFGIGKQVTPAFGLEFQGMGYVNTGISKTAFDASDVSLSGKVNLMNLFGGYPGEPRVFEVEALAGIGWLHYYMDGPGDTNSWSTRLGMNLNFNLGESRAWTLGIRPAIVYDMQGDFSSAKSRFNINHAAFELTAGLTYHFACSNGTRHFAIVRAYDPMEISRLNATINDLRMDADLQNVQLAEAAQENLRLQNALEECLNQPVAAPVVNSKRVPESIVTFRQGKSTVDVSQLPNVERVALFLKKNADAKVVIRGYASPEGDPTFNERLAEARARAVKSILTEKYKIDEARVTAEGQGIGDMFSDPDWNRVSICTIGEAQ